MTLPVQRISPDLLPAVVGAPAPLAPLQPPEMAPFLALPTDGLGRCSGSVCRLRGVYWARAQSERCCPPRQRGSWSATHAESTLDLRVSSFGSVFDAVESLRRPRCFQPTPRLVVWVTRPRDPTTRSSCLNHQGFWMGA